MEGIRRPGAVLAGPMAVLQGTRKPRPAVDDWLSATA